MYHGDTHPQVLSLRSGFLTLVPEDVQKYHRIYSSDFTWEVYCKRLSPEHPPRPSTRHPNSARPSEPVPEGFPDSDGFPADTLFQSAPGATRNDTNISQAFCALSINE